MTGSLLKTNGKVDTEKKQIHEGNSENGFFNLCSLSILLQASESKFRNIKGKINLMNSLTILFIRDNSCLIDMA